MKVIEQLKALSEEKFLAMYEALAQHGLGPLDAEVAKAVHFRPQAIRKLAMPRRARKAKAILISTSNAELCYELFGTYLIKEHKELVTSFLDDTGVEHAEGMIEDLDNNKPQADKVAEAVKAIDAKFDAEDVTVYLALCAEQWPDVDALDKAWRERLASAV